jgi:hypothetical protein
VAQAGYKTSPLNNTSLWALPEALGQSRDDRRRLLVCDGGKNDLICYNRSARRVRLTIVTANSVPSLAAA